MHNSQKRILSIIISLVMVLSAISVLNFSAVAATEEKTVLVSCSDFQATADSDGALNVKTILNRVKESGITKIDGLLFTGDMTRHLNNQPSQSESGLAALKAAVKSRYNIADSDMVFVRGNHDPVGTQGASESGNNDDADGKYGVFVIHEDDYMWNQGVSTTNGNWSVSDDEQTVKNTAANLKAYFDEKIENKFDKPIFVLSHLPLHYTARTSNGDCQYAKYIFDELNAASEKGLNIYFLFGHNHSGSYDDYIGGSSIYLQPNDQIVIPDVGSRTTFQSYTLKFSYLTAGYVGYYNSGNPVDKSLNMVVYEIYDNRVEISRYNTSGITNLKGAGYGNVGEYQADTNVYASPFTSVLKFFRKKGLLSNNKSIDASDLLILKQHLLNINEMDAKISEYADMNDDGVIDSTDMTILSTMIIGLS